MPKIKKEMTLMVLLLALIPLKGFGQIRLEAEMTLERLMDNSIAINADIYDSEEYEPAAQLNIEFFSVLDTTTQSLGTSYTDEEGKVTIEDIPFSKLLLDNSHTFYISYAPSDSGAYVSGGEIMSYKEVNLQLTFEEIDSVKQIVVIISSWDEDGTVVFVDDMDVYLYVPRLFSQLPIGEIYTENGGKGTVAFPTDLPGGAKGEMTVIAKIEDSEDYGTMEVSKTIDWATPLNDEAGELPRALWSSRPPMWMIITFAVLMIGVWFHYGWIILNLFRMRSKSSENAEINYEV